MRIVILARALGVLYLIAGLAGFVALLAPAPPPGAEVIALTSGYAWLIGLFPVNAAHDIVHIVVGIAGLLSGSHRSARRFFRATFVLFAILTLMGLARITSTLFGIAPLYGWDVALHAATALIALFAGWGAPSRQPTIDMSLPPPPTSMPPPPPDPQAAS